jgi:hypothetical protein
MDATNVLEEFVNDVEAAHGEGWSTGRLDWPDLVVTYHHAKAVLAKQQSKSDICALRRTLDTVAEKFGKFAYVEIHEDGSGLVRDNPGGLKGEQILAQFDGLGELATILGEK